MQRDTVVGYLALSHAGAPERLQAAMPAGWTVLPLLPSDLEDAARLAPIRYLVVAGCKVSAAVLDRMPGLRLLHKLGVGYDDMDLPALEARGVRLANCPLGSAEAVAEHALAMTLAALKALHFLDHAVHQGLWPKWEVRDRLRQLRGQQVGIVGLGPIGQAAAGLFHALGATVRIHTRTPVDPGGIGTFEPSLERLFEVCSIVSLHVPLTPHSRHLVTRDLLIKLGPEGILVNTSRGQVVDQAALVDCLNSGALGFAALDVLQTEPPWAGEAILSARNVLLTPHIGGGGEDVIHRKLRFIAGNLVVAEHGGAVQNIVQDSPARPQGGALDAS